MLYLVGQIKRKWPIFVVRDKFVIFEKWPFERNVVNGVGPLSVCENLISNPTVCFAQPKIKQEGLH